MSALKIREVTGPQEIKDVCFVDRACFPNAPWQAEVFHALLASSVESIYVLENELGFLGYIVIQYLDGEGEIERIGILPEARGRGLAKLLLCNTLVQLSLDNCVLEVSANNDPALRLYSACGFKQAGRRSAYYRDGSDAWIMTWKRNSNEHQ